MKDRLENPLEFLESMRANFLGNDEVKVKSLLLIDTLTDAIQSRSAQKIQNWIESFDFDPELLGSAFLMIYRFAIEYYNSVTGAHVSHFWNEA